MSLELSFLYSLDLSESELFDLMVRGQPNFHTVGTLTV